MYIRPYTLFSTVHPALLMAYAAGAPVLSMLSRSPVCLFITAVCAVIIHYYYLGGKATRDGLKITILFAIVIMIFNMMTNPGGLIVLVRIGTWNITLESLCYGLANGGMLGTVLFWFRCFPAIVPNDKFLYLFGRRFQRTALLLSMILKLFPETRYKIRCIQMADGAAGDRKKTSVKDRVKTGVKKLSCLMEWSMEDSIETADSMKARGYGDGHRTSYERYHFSRYDICILVVLVLLFAVSMAGVLWQDGLFDYYPTLDWKPGRLGVMIGTNVCYIGFLLMPLWMEGWKKGGGIL